MINWRWHLFWIKDKLNGGKIKKIYNELNEDYVKFDEKRQNNKLNDLLKYAKENSKFYEKYKLDINSFPIINKQIIKDNMDKLFVDKYDKQKIHKMSTSGSTGTPFTVYQNIEKRNAVLAEIIFFGKLTNYYFGEKQTFTRIWIESNKKSRIKKFLQNMIPFDISTLDDNNLKKLDNTLINKKVKNMLGYASSYDKYYEYLKQNPTTKKYYLKSIISGSELLNENTRKGLSNYFNCPVYSRYSNQENGLLGQDNGTNKKFWLNETNYFFEFLKLDSDKPAKEGELSRVVVTDLYNYAMPMIRYDTGDLCKFSIKNGKYYIDEIFGKRRDLIYDTNDNPIEAASISVNFWNISHIIQFQFVQIGKGKYKIYLNVDDNFNGEDEVINTFKKLLGKNAQIEIEYVNEISVLNSGKRKSVVNNYKKMNE